FEEFGEAGFRELERQVVAELARFQDLVLALGGGTVLRDDNVSELLLTGVLVELRADPATLAQRLGAGDQIADRPLLDGDDPEAALRHRYAERAGRYAEVADVTIDAERPVDEVVEAILQWAMSVGDVLTPSEHEQVMT
ncbi:MAG: shikimate kinase, partial [Nitriliruptoraceae bacterium]